MPEFGFGGGKAAPKHSVLPERSNPLVTPDGAPPLVTPDGAPPLVTPDGAERRSGVQPVETPVGCVESTGSRNKSGTTIGGPGRQCGPVTAAMSLNSKPLV